MWEIKSHPEKCKRDISSSLKLSPGRANTQFKKIKHLVKEVAIPTGGRGRKPEHFILTKEAHELLGISYEGSRGADVVHDFHISRYLKQLIDADIKATINYKLGNKSADLGITLPNKDVIAVEISNTTSAEWEFEQAQRNLEAGFSKVLIIATTKSKAEKISSLIMKHLVTLVS